MRPLKYDQESYKVSYILNGDSMNILKLFIFIVCFTYKSSSIVCQTPISNSPTGLHILLNSAVCSLPVNAILGHTKGLRLTEQDKSTYIKMIGLKNNSLAQEKEMGANFGEFGFSAPVLEAIVRNEDYLKNVMNTQFAQNKIGILLPKSNIRYKGNNCLRFYNAHKMQKCIQQHNLSSLDVAHKEMVFVHDHWAVFAHNVKPAENTQLTDTHVKDLITLVKHTEYTDFKHPECPRQNWLMNQKGKLVCVDTGPESYGALNHTGERLYQQKKSYVAALHKLDPSLTSRQRKMIKNASK